MTSFTTSFFDFFIPRICISCDGKLTSGEDSICADCYSHIKYAELPFLQSEYKKKFEKDFAITSFLSLFVFEEDSPIRHLLHGLKYDKKFRIGYFLGKTLAANFDNIIKSWNADIIIPIPLHKLKKAERGFNQSYYIAKGMAKSLNIKVNTNIIQRKYFTPSQTKLNLNERKINMQNAFVMKNYKAIKNKNIILLDDVITTGATITECANILKKHRANNVFAISVAIADYN